MYQAPPESRTYSEYLYQDENPADELEAEAQVNEWLRYGRDHADPNQPEGEGIISALFNHYRKEG
jgi:hypothetical protein